MVYVLNNEGKPLMPTSRHGKVRHLLEQGKAKVVRRTPFTIQLTYETENRTQPVTLGVDAGSKTVGLSADTENKELFAAEFYPRNDVVGNLSTRREFRRARRNRTTRYRKPRFNNRVHSKHKGWLAPSVEVKIHNHEQAIALVDVVLPITAIRVETAEFDLQRLKAMLEGKPLPVGKDYQLGEQYDEYNVRQYVLHRDGYTCQCCGKTASKSKGIKFHVHHMTSRRVGGNAPDNLITLCEDCHKKLHKGLVELKQKKRRLKSTRDATFMGIMRKTLLERLKANYPGKHVCSTYGYITKYHREKAGLEKTHIIDARCIAKSPTAEPADDVFAIKPLRRHNRQIHKATIGKGGYRKLNQATKYVFGFRLFDKVRYNGKECFVFGRRNSGSFDNRTLSGLKISAGVGYKKLQLLEKSRNIIIERRREPFLSQKTFYKEVCGDSFPSYRGRRILAAK